MIAGVADTDFAAVGRALGDRGVNVSSWDQLAVAIESSLMDGPFSVIACRIPRKSHDGRI